MTRLIFILSIFLTLGICSQAQTIQYIGAPTTTVISRGNFRSDSLFYLPKRLKAPTDTAALRYQISDSSVYVWTGSQWLKPATDTTSLSNRINLKLNISDTASMLSPYYRSATATAALALKVNISDTSTMLGNYVRHAGYGLTKSGQGFLVDTLNISTRAWRQKGIDSVRALISAGTVSGSGTLNYIPRWTGTNTLGNSQLSVSGDIIYIGEGTDNRTIQNTASGQIWAFTNRSGGDTMTSVLFRTNTGRAAAVQFSEVGVADRWTIGTRGGNSSLFFSTGSNTQSPRMTMFGNGRIGVNTTTDAGYQFDVNGSFRSAGASYLNTGGGSVGIGTTSPLTATGYNVLTIRNGSTGGSLLQLTDGTIDYRLQSVNGDPVVRFGTFSNHGIDFYLNSTQYHRFLSNGSVGINRLTADYTFDINGTLRSVNGANFATTSGNVGVGTASPAARLTVVGAGAQTILNSGSAADARMEFHYNSGREGFISWDTDNIRLQADAGNYLTFFSNATERGRINSAGEWIIDASGTDAGDYKLQVVGNARIGTGKLDIASNTTFGLGIARSGTSEVAGQIYNSNGILYFGAESSAGGQIFTGSSAYAAVIGSGANYPLQFATNNATRATINTNGELLIGTTTDNGDFKLQVNGNGYITGNLQINPSANTTGIYMPSMSWTGSNANASINLSGTLNTTGAPSLIYADISDVASGAETNFIQFVNSDTKFRVTKQGDIQTAAPSGGTARKWKLGSVVATGVQLDTSNYVEVEINGTFYRLAIVTPL
jgi:hypothetical protein